METIYDIGMYDAADTQYYLECGYRVVAVEAIPELIARATERLHAKIVSGQLICVHGAISSTHLPVEIALSERDLSSSTLFPEKIAQKTPAGTVRNGTKIRGDHAA